VNTLVDGIPRIGHGLDQLTRDVAAWLLASWPALLPTTAAGVAGLAAAAHLLRWWRGRRQLRRWHTRARLVTILPPPRVDPDGGEALWANLIGLLRPYWARLVHGQPHLAFEYLTTADGIRIRMWIPGPIPPGLIERAITAAWPGTRTHTTPAPPPPTLDPTTLPSLRRRGPDPGCVVAGGQLRLARTEQLPIGHDRGPDPLRALLAAPGPLGPGETAWVQILARPVTGHRLTHTHRAGGATGLAGRIGNALLAGVLVLLREILDILTPGPIRSHPTPATPRAARRTRTSHTAPGYASGSGAGSTAWTPVGPRERLVASAENRAAAAKTRGGAYATLIRYATTTPAPQPNSTATHDNDTHDNDTHDYTQDEVNEGVAEARARAVARGRAHAIASAFAGFSDHNHYRRRRLRHPLTTLRERRLGRGDVLSIAELAAIAHLPTDDHVPGLRRAGAAAIAPPPQIPRPGPGVKLLGDSDITDATTPPAARPVFPGQPGQHDRRGGVRRGRPVGLSVADARHHLHVVGPTGTGKSTLLARMVLDDVDAGRGVVVIDPKGDLVTDIAHRLPPTVYRDGRVVLLDPDSANPPPSLNPLAPHPSAADRLHTAWAGDPVVENIVSVFARLFAKGWGPRTDDVLRVALLTLRAGPEVPTLAQIPALLTDPAARYRAARHTRHPLVRNFWRAYEHAPEGARAQAINPLLNKLRAVLLRPFAWRVLAAGASTVGLPQILDHGGLLLARLPKGRLGDDTTRLIGSLVLAQTWQATTARAAQHPRRRRDASIVLDECQNFLHLPYSIQDMLAEARGFAVSITLANQHLAQLPADLREGISANARNKIIFSVGPDDAHDLARHTRPELGEHDLGHLDGYHAAARLVVDGAETPAFTLTTRPLPPPARRAFPSPHHRAA
jgi:hypothetical protein